MEIHIQAEIKMGLGSSQGLGLICKGYGSRVILLTEALYCTSREKDILRLSLERANLKALHLEFLEGDDPHEFARINRALIRGARAQALVVFGGNRLLHLARWMVMEEALENELKLVLVPAIPGLPFLFRREGFWGSGHPTDSQFFEWKSPLIPVVVYDPFLSTNMGAKQSVAHLLQTLFFLLEAALHEQAGLFLRSLCLGCIQGLWNALEKVFEQPTKGDARIEGYEAGLAASLAHHVLPRLSGAAAVMILEGISFVPQGMSGAVLVPWLLEKFAPKVPDTLARIATALGLDLESGSSEAVGMELARSVRKLMDKFGLPLRFRDLDLVESEILHAAELVKDWKTPAGGVVGVEALPVFLRSAF